MAKTKYTIGGIEFTSKKAVTDYVRQNIHSKYKDHEAISDEHLRFMLDLLRHHPWGDQKVGLGVVKMWVQPNPPYPTRSFWLERVDGTKTDFSFYQCVEPPNSLRDFKEACRSAVAPTIIRLRLDHFETNGEETICPVLNKPITLYTSHVDHEPPLTFDVIVDEYIKAKQIDIERAPLVVHGDGNLGNAFADESFANEWVAYHNGKATLRVISREANLSAVKTGAAATNLEKSLPASANV